MSGLHAPQAHHSRVRGTMASLHHGPSVSLRSTRPAAPGAARATVRSCHGRSQLQRARAVSCRAASELEQLQGVRVVKASSPNEEVELLSLWQVGIFPATRQAHHHMPMQAVRRTAGMHAYYSTARTVFRPWFKWLCARFSYAPHCSPQVLQFSISDRQEASWLQ